MIRITVELVPYGIESGAVVIEKMTIANDGKNKRRPEFGDYRIEYSDHGDDKIVLLKNHRRSDGVWELVKKALR